jgi:hypothetical protein
MSSPLTGAGLLGAQLEKVDKNLWKLLERSHMLYTTIKKQGRTEEVSMRPFRIPLMLTPTGLFSGYEPDGGDLGVGNGPVIDHAEVTPIYHKIAAAFTQKSLYATNSSAKAIVEANTLVIADALETLKLALDQTAQGPGNGQLGVVQSVSGSVITMAIPNGATGVYDGEQVNILNSTETVQRNVGGPLTITNHDMVESNTITFSGALPGSVVAGDIIVDPFITPTNPFGLFGIKYHQNNATTGTWLNLDRSAYPYQLRTSRVNAGGSPLLHVHLMQVMAKIKKSIGPEKFEKGNYRAYMNTEQEIQYKQLGINVQTFMKGSPQGNTDKMDVLYSNFTIEGIKPMISTRADQTRIDFLDLDVWGRVVSKEISFYKDIEGRMIFPQYGNSGGIAATWLFYYDIGHQIFVTDPLRGGFVDTLAVPNVY